MKKFSICLFFGLLVILGGCSSVMEPNAGLCEDCQEPSAANGFVGKFVLRWEAKNDLNTASNISQKYCVSFNGVRNQPSVYTRFTNYVKYQFQCNGYTAPLPVVQQAVQPQIQLTAPSNTNTDLKAQIEEAKAKCADLGFKTNTEAFGKCVLRLTN